MAVTATVEDTADSTVAEPITRTPAADSASGSRMTSWRKMKKQMHRFGMTELNEVEFAAALAYLSATAAPAALRAVTGPRDTSRGPGWQ